LDHLSSSFAFLESDCSRLPETAERIAHHDVHPTEQRDGEIVAFGKIPAVIVSRQKKVWTRRELEIWFVYVAGRAGYAVVNVIGG
jgi:hypothetical protein